MLRKSIFPLPNNFSSLNLIIFNSLFLWLLFTFCRQFLGDADLVENYAWGITWTLGNNKHPPLFGWITAAWFQIFPTSNWAYFLLNELNLLVALIFLMLSLRKLFGEDKVYIALALTITILPLGVTHGYKYNANLAQLPFITGYTWALLTALIDKRTSRYFLAGLFAGSAILCKYSSVIILGAITIAIWLYSKPKLSYFLPKLSLIAIVTMVVTSPHFYWAIQHGAPSIHYMHERHVASSIGGWLSRCGYSLFKLIQYVALPLMIFGMALIFSPRTLMSLRPTFSRRAPLGLIIFLLSVLGTMTAAYIEHIDTDPDWFIVPSLFFGWALIDIFPEMANLRKLRENINILIVIYFISFIGIYFLTERNYPSKVPHVAELPEIVARDVTQIYHETYNKPIEYAAGSFPLPYFMSFSSSDHPLGLFGLDLLASNWIDADKFRSGSKVIICASEVRYSPVEPACSQHAVRLLGLPDSQKTLKYVAYDRTLKAQRSVEYNVLMYR